MNEYLPQDVGQPQAQQVPVSQDELYATQIQEERVKNVIGQTSPDNQLKELQWRLKGYIFNELNQEWEKIEDGVPEPSSIMVSKYISLVSSLLNDNTRFSTLQPEEINKLMAVHIEWFVDDMDTNAELYGIHQDYSERTRIGHILLNFIFTMLKRSQNGAEAKRIWGSLSLNEQQNPMAAYGNKKQGFLQSMRDWKI